MNGWQTLNAALTAKLPSHELPHELPVDALDAESVGRFQSAMDDDLNTAAALAVLFELAKSIQREVNLRTHQSTQDLSDRQLSITWQTLKQLAYILGLEATASSPDSSVDIDVAWVETLLHQRQAARQEKRYAESDRLRAELQAAGIAVVDHPGGKTEWHRA